MIKCFFNVCSQVNLRKNMLFKILITILIIISGSLDYLKLNTGTKSPFPAFFINNQVNAAGAPLTKNGINDPVLSTLMEREVNVPHTKQFNKGNMANLINMATENATGAKSILNNFITNVNNPHDDMLQALEMLSQSAENGIINRGSAQEIVNILLGTTSGRIYDGFALLNFNRWNEPLIPSSSFPEDAIAGEYKTKTIRHSGKFERNFKTPSRGVNPAVLNGEDENDKDANEVIIWEVDVNMLWYGQQFDSDTFFIHVPVINSLKNVPSLDDTLRINYHIYSLEDEDFAPTQLLFDANPATEFPGGGSVRLPHKGEDSVWVKIRKNTVTHITVQHTAFRFLRGIYTWGWRIHPPRVHFLDFLFELKNAHTEKNELDPRAQSMSKRNKMLSIETIGDAAPEKKIYKIARAALNEDVTADELFNMLNNPDSGPEGTYVEWMDLMTNQIQLPPEVNNILSSENKTISDYDYIVVYLNNEMYGNGPLGNVIRNWDQGDIIHNRVFNLDKHTHYYRNVDFGPPLSEEIAENVTDGTGIFSFEIMNFKPTYGTPKVVEMQWRTGWGFRPHYSIIQQKDVFPRDSDNVTLKPFAAPVFSLDKMELYYGYQYSPANRRGNFVFDPPRYIIQREKDDSERIQSKEDRSAYDYLFEFTREHKDETLKAYVNNWERFKKKHPKKYKQGLTIGRRTEGFGFAKMCDHNKHVTNFCPTDLSMFHPLNIKNFNTDKNVNDALYFPTFLINPDKNGGDIIPPTPAWEPFLYLSPKNGTIYIDPEDKQKGFWVDLTYAHGKPVAAMDNIEVNIEMPRAKGQLFYQFDDLYHDNDIFSPHPISSQR